MVNTRAHRRHFFCFAVYGSAFRMSHFVGLAACILRFAFCGLCYSTCVLSRACCFPISQCIHTHTKPTFSFSFPLMSALASLSAEQLRALATEMRDWVRPMTHAEQIALRSHKCQYCVIRNDTITGCGQACSYIQYNKHWMLPTCAHHAMGSRAGNTNMRARL